MKRLLYIVIFFIFLIFVGCNFIYANVIEKDKKVLLDIYKNTNGDEWLTKWDLETPVSQWHGIKVHNNRVVAIDLLENNLVGQLPESIGELQYLQSLNLAFNLIRDEQACWKTSRISRRNGQFGRTKFVQ